MGEAKTKIFFVGSEEPLSIKDPFMEVVADFSSQAESGPWFEESKESNDFSAYGKFSLPTGRQVFVNWRNVDYVENCYCKFDELTGHEGEATPLGDTAKMAKYAGWVFPRNDSVIVVADFLARKCKDFYNCRIFEGIFLKNYLQFAKEVLRFWQKGNDTKSFDAAVVADVIKEIEQFASQDKEEKK
ncbi:hypothetical protein EFM17_00885 [Lactobacillus delbrueckii]|nr:hypothetical protein [Lactobacillus delbrueckii]